jgi:hypothetical protein
MLEAFCKMLGCSPDDRLLMINSDDFGMCHAANVGTIRALTEGVATSATLLVPCPWAPEALAFWKAHPHYSIGIEMVLTSEWEGYRWGPLSPRDKVPSLLDPDGYFWGNVQSVQEHVKAEEAEIEVRAQIERVYATGPEPSHLDNHMGSLFVRPDLYAVYQRMVKEYRLPARDPKIQEDPGWPCIDAQIGSALYYMALEDGKEERLHEILRGLKPGLYELYPHCAADMPEIHAICSYSKFIPEDQKSQRGRISDTVLYTTPRVKRFIEENGFRLITWRQVRDAIRKHF